MSLAEQLADHPRWEWRIGMVHENGSVCVGPSPCGRESITAWVEIDDYRDVCDERDIVAPDINHPATKGWLLHMLREATGKAIYVAQRVGHWAVYIAGVDTLLAQDDTEGEALAAALLAVWGAL